MREADAVHRADHMTAGGWESVDHTYEGINFLFTKFYCTTPDKTDVYVTKCSGTAKSTAQEIFNTYWSGQGQWDFSTISKQEILENRGQGCQIVYQQHKTLSAASNKKDVVFERQFYQEGNSFRCYAVSVEHPSRPDKFQQHSRSNILFHGCWISDRSPGVVDIEFVWCWDFNGWVHQKFVDAEKTKVALRLTRIVKNSPGASPVLNHNPLKRVGTPVPGRAPSNSYAEYNQAIREAGAPAPEPVYVPSSNIRPMSQPFKPIPVAQPTPVHAPTGGGPNFCPNCGGKTAGARFCSGCGTKLG